MVKEEGSRKPKTIIYVVEEDKVSVTKVFKTQPDAKEILRTCEEADA